MNTQYAIEVIDLVERGMLECNSSLSKEACRYLVNRKNVSTDDIHRVYKILEKIRGKK